MGLIDFFDARKMLLSFVSSLSSFLLRWDPVANFSGGSFEEFEIFLSLAVKQALAGKPPLPPLNYPHRSHHHAHSL